MKSKQVYILLAFVLFIGSGILANRAQARESSLREVRWKNRVLLMQDKGSTFSKALRLLGELETCQPGIQDRNLVIWVTPEIKTKAKQNKVTTIALKSLPELDEQKTSASFVLELIGLDGGSKKIWNKPPSCKDIFALIDAMPMRVQELANPSAQSR